MITESQIYWITRMSYLQGFAFTISILALLGAIIYLIVSIVGRCEEYDNDKHKWNKHFWGVGVSIVLSVLLVCGACFMPSTKEYCAIKAIPVIINNEEVQQLPEKVVDLANEWIDELKPDNNRKGK